MKPRLSIIVAVAENDVIGGGNTLLWNLPDDLKRFRELTERHPVIMGRKTHASIGRPLPRRRNIVVSHDARLDLPGCEVAPSFGAALAAAVQGESKEVFVIGGGQIYRQALPFADRVYFTRVHASFQGDVTFPPLDPEEWVPVSREEHPADERHAVAFDFLVYERR